ncbi:MAG TPA: hypothetical protein VGI64_01005 [Streptosporangiaceae bacterium]
MIGSRTATRGTLATGLAIAALLATGCGGGGASQQPGAAAGSPRPAPAVTVIPDSPLSRQQSPASAVSPVTRPPDTTPRVIAVPPPPARLHQTMTRPSAHTRVFRAEMTDLWAAVVTGKARLAWQAFFPLAAYKQVKAIFDPAADWRDRLFAQFRLDVAAAHHHLGRPASRARLVRVITPSAEAAWIVPGVCENGVGYWHVGGARLVYREDGTLRSIGIASLISWRGRWYVVHFGAVLRPGSGGVVDSPAIGPGVPGPAGGC